MASKLRRAPLFGIDSGFSIVNPCKPKGVFKMECEVTSSPSAAYGSNRTNGASPGSSASPRASSASSGKSQLHVDFIESGEVKEKREKYLTAKYGSHQMSLIRKRLSVEMWLYDELQKLYEGQEGSSSASAATHDVEIDLDEVLDLDGDVERRKYLQSLLTDAKKSQDVVNVYSVVMVEKEVRDLFRPYKVIAARPARTTTFHFAFLEESITTVPEGIEILRKHRNGGTASLTLNKTMSALEITTKLQALCGPSCTSFALRTALDASNHEANRPLKTVLPDENRLYSYEMLVADYYGRFYLTAKI